MAMRNSVCRALDFFQAMDPHLIANLVTKLQPTRVEGDRIVYKRGDKSEESKG
jgi:hypothetical protein